MKFIDFLRGKIIIVGLCDVLLLGFTFGFLNVEENFFIFVCVSFYLGLFLVGIVLGL